MTERDWREEQPPAVQSLLPPLQFSHPAQFNLNIPADIDLDIPELDVMLGANDSQETTPRIVSNSGGAGITWSFSGSVGRILACSGWLLGVPGNIQVTIPAAFATAATHPPPYDEADDSVTSDSDKSWDEKEENRKPLAKKTRPDVLPGVHTGQRGGCHLWLLFHPRREDQDDLTKCTKWSRYTLASYSSLRAVAQGVSTYPHPQINSNPYPSVPIHSRKIECGTSPQHIDGT